MAQLLLEEDRVLPVLSEIAQGPDADLIEFVRFPFTRERSKVKPHELLDHLRQHGCAVVREG